MNGTITSEHLILASQSPRRRELLSGAGLTFRVIPSSVNEDSFEKCEPGRYARALARTKTKEISSRYPDSWVIGADTIVIIDDQILEKPSSKAHACEMLHQLSGRVHEVITGYAIVCEKSGVDFCSSEKTEVTFKRMSEKEISWYVETDEPYDKAGAYAIQGIGSSFVKGINGSYTNVVGLPLCEVMAFLMEKGAINICGIKRERILSCEGDHSGDRPPHP